MPAFKQKLFGTFFFLVIALISGFIIKYLETRDLLDTTLQDFSAQKKLFVTRGEFANLLFTVKNLPEPKEKNCFPDVLQRTKSAKAICALKEGGFLEGIMGENFGEKKNLRMKELVGILCRSEKWVIKPAPGFLECLREGQTKGVFDPSEKKSMLSLIKRKTVTEVFEIITGFRMSAPEEETEETNNLAAEEPVVQEKFPEFTPVLPAIFSKSFFETVELKENLSNTFYRHELFRFEGSILTAGKFDEVFVFLIPENPIPDETEKTINFLANIDAEGNFSIPVYFHRPGNYQLGIIPGKSGKSKVVNISVREKLPDAATVRGAPQTKPALAWVYQNGEVRFSWKNPERNIVRLTFEQGKQKVTYFSRKPISEITPQPADFAGFKSGNILIKLEFASGDGATEVNISSPWVVMETKEISVSERPFRTISDDITFTRFDEFLETLGTFVFEGKAKVAAAGDGAYTDPKGEAKIFTFTNAKGKKSLPKGTDLRVELPVEKGITIFEVNDPDGSALINAPIFVETGIPLLPDYFTRVKAVTDLTPLNDVKGAREEVLAFINEAREQGRRKPVRMDLTIDSLAQKHCDDMAKRNFFSHYNPEGESPDDRRQTFGIETSVRENLAKSPSIEYAHEGLMRSPLHRKNILEEKWTRVGIGVSKNDEGTYYICEEFSTDPLSETNLTRFEEDFLAKASATREAKRLFPFTRHEALSLKAKEWSQKMALEDFFHFKSPSGEALLTIVRNTGIRSAIQSHLIEGTDIANIEKEFLAQPPIEDARFTNIGIGFAKNSIGKLKVTVIYSE